MCELTILCIFFCFKCKESQSDNEQVNESESKLNSQVITQENLETRFKSLTSFINNLDPSTAFVSLSLFSMLRFPLNILPYIINGLTQVDKA